MKNLFSNKTASFLAICCLATSMVWASPPPDRPHKGGLPACEEELFVCEDDLVACEESEVAFPATGQTSCWDSDGILIDCAGTGHDGDIQAGADLSYTDNGLTITDNNTKLEWMKQDDNGGDCASFPGYLDKDCIFTWDGAFEFVAQLNIGPCFADHCDWRVPNAKELQSIVNYQYVSPAVSEAFHDTEGEGQCVADCMVDACSCTAASVYWSSTSFAYVTSVSGAWFVSFSDGFVGVSPMFIDRRVRAVRGGL